MKIILPPTRKKSRISLWKLITFSPKKQIQPNKLIKLKESNCDNNKFVWVNLILKLQRNSISKKCQQTFFKSKIGKSGQNKFNLFTLKLFFEVFKFWENFKAQFYLQFCYSNAVSQIWNTLSGKKHKCDFFFGSEEVVLIYGREEIWKLSTSVKSPTFLHCIRVSISPKAY